MKWIIAAAAIVGWIAAWNAPYPAWGHDSASWIMENPATSWCCGPEDCESLPDDAVAITAEGALVKSTQETIPYWQLKESIDGRWWRCRHPSGNTRCLFRPPFGS